MPKGSALEGFAALYDGSGNSSETVYVEITTKCVLDFELVRTCQQHGDRPHKGTPLGKFPELWPFDALKRALIAHANKFVGQLASHEYDAIGSIYAFEVWGPYTEKVGDLHEYTPEEGNHTIPKAYQRKAQRVWGYQGDEFSVEKGCAFLIKGKFTRKAVHGHMDEETGVLLV